MLEPIKEMPTLASAGPNVEMTLEKMPVPEQPEGDDGGGNASGAVAEENSIEYQLNAAKSWGKQSRQQEGGLQINGSPSALAATLRIINDGLEGFYTASLDNSKLTFTRNEAKDLAEMNSKTKAFYVTLNNATNSLIAFTINAYDRNDAQSKNILIGDITNNAFDISDIEAFGSNGYITARAALAHEIHENFLVQVKGMLPYGAHIVSINKVEGPVSGVSFDKERNFKKDIIEAHNTLIVPYNVFKDGNILRRQLTISFRNGQIRKIKDGKQ